MVTRCDSVSKMKEKSTLFSFFTKLPPKKTSTPRVADEAGEKNSVSPKESAKTSPQQKHGPVLEGEKAKTATAGPKQQTECRFKEMDIVWAKLDGYPWWPSIVCNHPTMKKFFKGMKRPEIHVQFFDETSSRAWLSARYVERFEGSTSRDCQPGGRYFNQKADIKDSLKEADKALKMTAEERKDLIVCIPSDDEMEDEDLEESMDIEENNTESEKDSDQGKGGLTPKGKMPPRQAKSAASKSKRRRIMMPSDSESSGDEFKPESEDEAGNSSDGSSGVDEKEITESEADSEPATPKKAKKRKRDSTKSTPLVDSSGRKIRKVLAPSSTPAKKVAADIFSPSRKPSTPSTPVVSSATKSKLSAFQANDVSTPSKPIDSEHASYPHNQLPWLQPENIRDVKGRHRHEEDYDPRTLKVPQSFLDKTTPAMRQWWELKSTHFDCVLFFKMGKFYELFNMDAEVGVKELGLIYMKGENAHCGFPEISFGRYSETLIQKGYKVARIEQTETPEMMQERCKNMGRMVCKYDKVVKREICRVSSKGTRTYSFIDGDTCESQSSFLLAVTERCEGDTAGEEGTYGICFVDTSIGKFHVGQFQDDRHSSRFRTLISHHAPAQVLLEKGKLSEKTNQIIQNNLLSVLKENLVPGNEFWTGQKTLKFLSDKNCFEDSLKKKKELDANGNVQKWPKVIRKMVSDDDSLGLTPKTEYELALSALGACIWYLKECKLEQELLSMCSFKEYLPLDVKYVSMETNEAVFSKSKQLLVLDGISLANLEILQNSLTGGIEGTLLERLDQCSTAFGKRLFRQWLCAPLCNPHSINDRLNAMEDLMENQDKVEEAIEVLKKLPDLERFLSKIHSLGSLRKSEDHPDGRAIFFEESTYGKRKILDFLTTLEGFQSAQDILKIFEKTAPQFKSKILKQSLIVAKKEEGNRGWYPDLRELLKLFDNAFDKKKAKELGAIIPRPGVDEDYDQAIQDVKSMQGKLDLYLDKQRKRLGCSSIKYWGTAKNRYQLEVPEAALSRHIPEEYELQSSKKGFKRYWTPVITDMLAELTDAEDRRDSALKDSMRRVFHKFDENYRQWNQAIQCLAVLDVLISMAQYSLGGEDIMCRPEFVEPSTNIKPFIAIQNGRHPCIMRTFSGGDYIPNDTYVGAPDETNPDSKDTSSCVLVTGPNMGGKSTLMRQVGLIVITAQLGCYVPADMCKLTPVDRVFTRLGARDNIMSGESTFFVELSETSSILQHATKHSLVLMDELGRGTATYDGTAIASAVVKELSETICCRTLFSTHYHSLVEEFSHDPNIRLGHMACMVENENDDDPSQETITFLYKFVSGACPKSYGFNAARLADIPDKIIKLARFKAHQFEESAHRLKLFRAAHKLMEQPWTQDNLYQLRKLIQA